MKIITANMKIRPYEPQDKAMIIDLIRLNTPTYFAVEEEEDLAVYLETERELYYVLLVEQQVIGSGGINFVDGKKTARMSWDLIHPDYQGQSLGTRLLKHRIEILNTIDEIQKIVVRTSQVAYKFYEKQGFELITIQKDYWAPGFDMYYMQYK